MRLFLIPMSRQSDVRVDYDVDGRLFVLTVATNKLPQEDLAAPFDLEQLAAYAQTLLSVPRPIGGPHDGARFECATLEALLTKVQEVVAAGRGKYHAPADLAQRITEQLDAFAQTSLGAKAAPAPQPSRLERRRPVSGSDPSPTPTARASKKSAAPTPRAAASKRTTRAPGEHRAPAPSEPAIGARARAEQARQDTIETILRGPRRK